MPIRYEITNGALPVTVYLMQGVTVIDSNVHNDYEQGQFNDVEYGNYELYFEDAMGCDATEWLYSTTTTTTMYIPIPHEYCVNYGHLYNWWVAQDSRNIAPEGWHVPSWSEYWEMLNLLGGVYDGGDALKSTEGWLDNPGTNSSGFTAVGSGWRDEGYHKLLLNCVIWLNNYRADQYGWYINIRNEADPPQYPYIAEYENWLKTMGASIRLIKDDVNDTGTMMGNDGKIYPTITIGDQVWMATNLTETRYRNGELISGPTFTDVEWDALSTEAYCMYEDTIANAGEDGECPTTTTTTTSP